MSGWDKLLDEFIESVYKYHSLPKYVVGKKKHPFKYKIPDTLPEFKLPNEPDIIILVDKKDWWKIGRHEIR